MPKSNTTNQQNTMPTAADLINIISGIYTSPLWEELRGYVDSLKTLRKLSTAIKALQESGKSAEAFAMICALHDVVAIEVPEVITSLEPYPDAVKLFVDEFVADTDDLIWDYEIEDNGGSPE